MNKLTRFVGATALAASALAMAAPAMAAGHAGGTLVIASTQVPRHLNGAVQSGTATAVPSTQIFASPLRYDEGWNPEPYLAESWEVSEDGLTFTLNLVKNAMDAMAESPEKRVEIEVRSRDGAVCLTVRDTGPGLSEPKKIFDPFYSTKEVGHDEGMGLGLSISYGLVQSFGGRIKGRNHAGGGAEFTVELEAAKGTAEAAE